MNHFLPIADLAVPVIRAPMSGVQGSALAIAVSDAGGLDSVPCARLSLSAMESELSTIRETTDKPFNVNFFCHQAPRASTERENRWRQSLADYFDEF